MKSRITIDWPKVLLDGKRIGDIWYDCVGERFTQGKACYCFSPLMHVELPEIWGWTEEHLVELLTEKLS